MSDRLIAVPDEVPRTHGRFARWLGNLVLALGGWRITGEWPRLRRVVIIAAPHSSGWDAVWGLAAKLAMGLDIRFMAKAELFRFPLGWLLLTLGAIPIDRSKATGSVDQTIEEMKAHDNRWFLLAPEGTRRKVVKWKSGFWRIARGADVPVVCVGFDYPSRTIRIGPTSATSADCDADLERFRSYFSSCQGLRRGV